MLAHYRPHTQHILLIRVLASHQLRQMNFFFCHVQGREELNAPVRERARLFILLVLVH